ncbi:protein of unknown function [Gracilibacillus ureilyticus]|uniref:DUF4652 domain-containing protein n=1 Tax=Gracilibacillus ureilyticus TaxID=531814 RepID=A0A1H9TZ53_9BACI|nr:DUF4652 domain-containing protein [Gracilibacillus ureilyticus]SES02535.1 protein of unknown function [Gracilibacillus ureilyticus]
MNRLIKFSILSTLIASIITLTACSDNVENSSEKQVEDQDTSDQLETAPQQEDKTGSDSKEEPIESPTNPPAESSQNDDISYAPDTVQKDESFLMVEDKDNYEPVFPTKWESSPDGTKEVLIDGRGQYAIEEGIGTLVLHDKGKDTYQLITLANKESQDTIKAVEWIDNKQLFIIVGMSFGMVSKGGQLYEVSLKDFSVKKVFPNLTEKEEISSIENNGDGTFTYELHTYEDDTYTTGTTEENLLTPNP